KKGIEINLDITEKKFKEDDKQFEKMDIFKKTNKIYPNWKKDLTPILRNMLDFKEVMNFLANYYKLKEEKEKKKDKLKS
ncbi:MAG: hypothetical protein AABX95_00710, partial [Nanoarchaeota archaeon]